MKNFKLLVLPVLVSSALSGNANADTATDVTDAAIDMAYPATSLEGNLRSLEYQENQLAEFQVELDIAQHAVNSEQANITAAENQIVVIRHQQRSITSSYNRCLIGKIRTGGDTSVCSTRYQPKWDENTALRQDQEAIVATSQTLLVGLQAAVDNRQIYVTNAENAVANVASYVAGWEAELAPLAADHTAALISFGNALVADIVHPTTVTKEDTQNSDIQFNSATATTALITADQNERDITALGGNVQVNNDAIGILAADIQWLDQSILGVYNSNHDRIDGGIFGQLDDRLTTTEIVANDAQATADTNTDAIADRVTTSEFEADQARQDDDLNNLDLLLFGTEDVITSVQVGTNVSWGQVGTTTRFCSAPFVGSFPCGSDPVYGPVTIPVFADVTTAGIDGVIDELQDADAEFVVDQARQDTKIAENAEAQRVGDGALWMARDSDRVVQTGVDTTQSTDITINAADISTLEVNVNAIVATQQTRDGLQDNALTAERNTRIQNDRVVHSLSVAADAAQDAASAVDQQRQDDALTAEQNTRIANDRVVYGHLVAGDAALQAQRDSDLTAQGIVDATQDAAGTAVDNLLLGGIQTNSGKIGANGANIGNNAGDIADNTQAITDERNERVTNDRIVHGLSVAADAAQDAAFAIDQQRQDDALTTERHTRVVNDRVVYGLSVAGDAALQTQRDSDLVTQNGVDAGQDNALATERDTRVTNDRVLHGLSVAGDTALQNNIDAEAFERLRQDVRLDGRIDTEVSDRIAGDNELQNNINLEATERWTQDVRIDGRIDTEVSDRIAGDAALQNNINLEATERLRQDVRLDGRIDTEVSDRIAGDNELQNNINLEATERLRQDVRIDGRIDSEVSDRIAGDAALQTNINLEATERLRQDVRLDGRIDVNTTAINVERNTRITNDRILGGMIATEANVRETADVVLQNNINNEAATRANADVRLANGINTNSVAISAEANTRANADRQLANGINTNTNAINDEATTRANADRQLANGINSNADAINDESSARVNADNHLAGAINDESSARVDADRQLVGAINDEAATRANADQAIVDSMNDAMYQEATTRQTVDNKMQDDMNVNTANIGITAANVTTLETRLNTNFEFDLQQDVLINDLYTRTTQNSSAIDGLRNNVSLLEGGIALGIAASTHHFDGSHTGLQLSVTAGTYGGASAASIAFGGKINNRVFINMNVGTTSRGQQGAGAGISFKF